MLESDDDKESDLLTSVSGIEMSTSRRNALIDVAVKFVLDSAPKCFLNYGIYTFIILVIGGPMWWITTSPYRGYLERFPADSAVIFPVQIRVFSTSNHLSFAKDIILSLSESPILSIPFESGAPRIEFKVEFVQKDVSSDEMSKLALNSKIESNIMFCDILLVDDELFAKLSGNSDCDGFVTVSGAVLLKVNGKNLEDVSRDFIVNNWMDLPKIANFITRTSESEITEHKSADVWNEVPISGAYNLHLIFVHDGKDEEWSRTLEKNARKEVEKMVAFLGDVGLFKISEEHFWDLFGAEILTKPKAEDESFSYSATSADLLNFLTEIDQRTSPVVSTFPLLKFVFLFTEKGITVDGKQSNGFTFLSWGSLINSLPGDEQKQKNAIYESFQTLLGASEGSLSEFKFCLSRTLPLTFVWNRFRRRAYLENIIKAKSFVKAVNALAKRIPQLVITTEVSQMIAKSKNLVEEALEEQNCQKAAAARILAEKAAKHETLLGMTDLTPYLKLGIYIPVGMPFVFPIFEIVLAYFYRKIRRI